MLYVAIEFITTLLQFPDKRPTAEECMQLRWMTVSNFLFS